MATSDPPMVADLPSDIRTKSVVNTIDQQPIGIPSDNVLNRTAVDFNNTKQSLNITVQGSIMDNGSVKSKKSKEPIDVETLKEELLNELKEEFSELIKEMVKNQGGRVIEESSEDSAY